MSARHPHALTIRAWLFMSAALFFVPADMNATAVSSLSSRGYTVLPQPQRVTLRPGDVRFAYGVAAWRLELGESVDPHDVAVESLKQDLWLRHRIVLSVEAGREPREGVLRLAIVPRSVQVGDALDRNKAALEEQAYRMEVSAGRVEITANASQGLFYAVETLIQLLKSKPDGLWLPEGEIVDWPDLELRVIYWDDAHHLERLDDLKRAVRQAAFFKINGFSIKFEGHFQYTSAPALVEPYALSRAELQELTDYAARFHVELIPYLDAPAHIAFILKHPEYAGLREFPESNYELCVTNPDSYKLLFGMYRDLLDATRGAKYFHLSTDEPYYVGLADNSQCREALRAKELGGPGRLLAEFVTKVSEFLHDHGRTVLFWGEYPMKPEDIPFLPAHLINGEVYGPVFDPAFKVRGIRQMVYVSTEGEEPLFPGYFVLPLAERLHAGPERLGRVEEMFRQISYGSARKDADLLGVYVAGWADKGLHPETFWLGYATGAAAGWHPGAPDPAEAMSAFYPLFYGPGATNMDRAVQLLSWQAEFWADSWETVPSSARKPIFGNSDKIFRPPRPARDQTLSLPPVPSAHDLSITSDWERENSRRLELAAKFRAENDELLGLLYANLPRVEFNHYNLEVLVAVSKLCRHNLEMLLDLGRIAGLEKSARDAAARGDAPQAVREIDQALDLIEGIREGRNRALQDAMETWTKSWFPRTAEANGRRFLHELDDVKDHLPDRTVDMSYLVLRELLLPLGEWAAKVHLARNDYARAHGLPTRTFEFNWKDIQM